MDFHEHHPKRRGEDVFGLIVLAVSVVLLWQAYGISGFSALSSPGAFPMAAAASMVIASVIVVYVVSRLVFQVVLPEGIVPERDIIAGIGNLFGAGEAQ